MTDPNAPLGVGVIGCGDISPKYLDHLAGYDHLRVVSCADLIHERAASSAARHGIPRAYSPAETLADPDVDIALNLTTPQAHAQVSLAAIEAGKHLYSEKPLAVERADGAAIIQAASEFGVMAGCAPDTFLGAGIQTSRKLLDDGMIGQPIGAAASFTSPGHEHRHPNPAFYYLRGGGPLFDMGPYYLTAMVALLGPIARVSGFAKRTYEERTSGIHPGVSFPVEAPTHVAGALDFACGAAAVITMSFDVWGSEAPRLEIYGTKGTISVPDPNTFGGPVRVKVGTGAWTEMPLQFTEGGRGIGVADMAYAIRASAPSRMDAALANHVLDAMQAIHESSDLRRHVDVQTTCARPEPRRA